MHRLDEPGTPELWPRHAGAHRMMAVHFEQLCHAWCAGNGMTLRQLSAMS